MNSRVAVRFLLCISICTVFAGCGDTYRETIFVAMSDGVQLRTEITKPTGFPDAGPFPVILVRSPYGRETERTEADKWRARGYVFVMQEIRGTGGSADPNVGALFESDAWGAKQDGREMMEWLLAQPWCNAQIGTLGYSGPALAESLLSGSSQDVGAQIIERSPARFYGDAVYVGGAPRGEFDRAFWNPGGLWEQHPSFDSFWLTLDTVNRAPEITAPAIHLAGWYDLFIQGGIDAFTARQENGGFGAAGRQKLIIGPWTHDNERQAGDVTFPNSLLENSPLGINRDTLRQQFMDFWIRGTGAAPDFTVLYYTMGALGENGAPGNEWHFANSWPPVTTSTVPAFLSAGGVLDSSTLPAAGSQTFTYNPLDPVPTRGGPLLYGGGAYNQAALTGRADVLSFQSAPLAEPLEVTGQVSVSLYVASSAVDTDFTAKLIDIYPNGVYLNVLDGIRRLRYRNGFETPEPNVPGTVYELDIDLWSTSYVFNTGHRIGLQISSSNSPRFLPNPNNGELLIEDGTPVSAQNTVFFGGATPSALYLPIAE